MNGIIANILVGLLIIGAAVAFGILTKKIFLSITIIVVYLVYILLRHGYTSTTSMTNTQLPTSYYMKKVGGQCPDYWKVIGQDKDNVTCQNQYDIRVNYGESKDGTKENCQTCKDKSGDSWKTKCPQCRPSGFSCYADGKNKTAIFPVIKKWPLEKDGKARTNRCQWWANCGITNTQNSSWIGLQC